MLPLQVLHSRARHSVWDYEVYTRWFEHSMTVFEHECNIGEWVVGAHEGVNGGLINDQVEALLIVCNISYIHYFVDHGFIPFFSFYFIHLRDYHTRNINVGDVSVASFVEMILNSTITTPNIQYSRL